MINWRIKNFSSSPVSLQNGTNLTAQIQAENNLDGDEIKSSHYRTGEVLRLLKAYSLGQKTIDESTQLAKCYYCESTSEQVAALQVEHYRPKKAIHDNNRQIIASTHGYYWLGLEWSNLILACSKCNGRGAKGNIFTISARYIEKDTSMSATKTAFDRSNCIADEKHLKSEKPDLLHPEVDNSYAYLKFNEFGEIKSKLRRGERTIEICKLDRDTLNIPRHTLIKGFQNSILEIVEFEEKGMIRTLAETESFFYKRCVQLRKRVNKELPYTLLARYMVEEFESFFLDKVPAKYKPLLRKAFKESKGA